MGPHLHLGKHVAPVRFIVFGILLAGGVALLTGPLGWRHGTMLAFDIAAAVFLLSIWPLLAGSGAREMRIAATRNDANRALLLAITGTVSLVVLVAVFSELQDKRQPHGFAVPLVLATLALAWLFSNMVYTLHYAHVFYVQSDTDGDGTEEDSGGLDFPDTKEPNYWDFIYFSFTLGMTFQTSDTQMTTTRMRRIATAHCLAAFVFNLGVLAFSINVLGGGGS